MLINLKLVQFFSCAVKCNFFTRRKFTCRVHFVHPIFFFVVWPAAKIAKKNPKQNNKNMMLLSKHWKHNVPLLFLQLLYGRVIFFKRSYLVKQKKNRYYFIVPYVFIFALCLQFKSREVAIVKQLIHIYLHTCILLTPVIN